MKTKDIIKGLLLAVPTIGRPTPVDWGFGLSALGPPINYSVQSVIMKGMEVADARNAIGKAAIEGGQEYIFLLGDDVQCPGHAIKQLIYRMEHDPTLGVAGGIYVAKSDPPFPLVFRGNGRGSYWNWKVGEYFEVTGIGMDATLIRTEVLKGMEYPWFKTVREDGYLEGKASSESWTEDLWFCDKVAEETDFRIFADSMIMCSHWQYLGGNEWKSWTLRNDSKPFRHMYRPKIRGKKRPAEKQILDIGCGPLHFDFQGEGPVTRVDIREEAEPDFRIDVRQLPFDDASFDVVFSSHTLEHFGRDEVFKVLDEWIRVLRPGGELRLIIPTIEWAAKQIIEKKGATDKNVLNVLYGSQEYATNFHRVGFTKATLTRLLKRKGFEINLATEEGYNLLVRGIKPGGKKKRKA